MHYICFTISKISVINYALNKPVPSIQLLKQSAIANAKIVAEQWKKEWCLGQVSFLTHTFAFSLYCKHHPSLLIKHLEQAIFSHTHTQKPKVVALNNHYETDKCYWLNEVKPLMTLNIKLSDGMVVSWFKCFLGVIRVLETKVAKFASWYSLPFISLQCDWLFSVNLEIWLVVLFLV